VSPGTASAPRRDARPLAALAAVAAALVVPVYLLAVRTGLGQRLDERPTGDLVDEHRHVLHAAETFLDIISVGSLAALGTTLVLVALLRGRVMVAVAAAAAILGANLTTQVLKRVLERPDLAGPGPSSPAGFPSGHTTVAMSLALALVLVAPSSWRAAAALGGAAYAAAVGLAVIGLGWHRPSDVAAAYLVATAWAAACAAVVRRLAPRGRAAVRPPLLSARAGGALAVSALAAFAVAVAVAAGREPDLVSVAAVHTSLVVLTVLALALGVALVAAFTALLGGGLGVAARPARAAP
jgi:membrane-associated phospholipid phosphatase